MPQRIQRKRTKGWRMPEGAIYVGRPSQWGNPFPIGTVVDRVAFRATRSGEMIVRELVIRDAQHAVQAYLLWLDGKPSLRGGHELAPFPPTVAEVRTALAGRDLVCWCPLGQPCHADVLLELANPETDA